MHLVFQLAIGNVGGVIVKGAVIVRFPKKIVIPLVLGKECQVFHNTFCYLNYFSDK